MNSWFIIGLAMLWSISGITIFLVKYTLKNDLKISDLIFVFWSSVFGPLCILCFIDYTKWDITIIKKRIGRTGGGINGYKEI